LYNWNALSDEKPLSLQLFAVLSYQICCLLSNWAFEIVGFAGKNKREAREAIEKIVKKTRSV